MSIFASTILVKAPSTLWLGDLYPRKTVSSVCEKKHGMSKKTRRMASVWGPMLQLSLVDLVDFQLENFYQSFIALMNALPEVRWHSSWSFEQRAAVASNYFALFASVTFLSS
jgi:hypothetical protein